MTWWGNWGPYTINSFHFHSTLSNLWAQNFNWEILGVTRDEQIHGAPIPHCSSHISKILWWLQMFDFGIFCHLLRLMGIYRSRYLKSFVLSCLFFLCFFSFFPFFFLFFSSLFVFVSLSVASLAPGPWTLSTHATQSLRHWLNVANNTKHLKKSNAACFYKPVVLKLSIIVQMW